MDQGVGLVMRTMMPPEVGIETIGSMLGQMEKQMSTQGPRILKALGFDKGIPKEMATMNELFNSLPPEIVEPLATYVSIEMFRRGD
jgi:hypothetical protein